MPLFPDIFQKSLNVNGVHCDVLIDPNERSGSGASDVTKSKTKSDDGVWRTVRGARVFIENGKITKGPDALIGSSPGADRKPAKRGDYLNPQHYRSKPKTEAEEDQIFDDSVKLRGVFTDVLKAEVSGFDIESQDKLLDEFRHMMNKTGSAELAEMLANDPESLMAELQAKAREKGVAKSISREDRIYRDKTESLHGYSADGTWLFSREGDNDSVKIEGLQEHLHGSVVTHNHPAGWEFEKDNPESAGNGYSKPDIRVAVKFGVAEMRVVSPGYRYSLVLNNQNHAFGMSNSEYLDEVVNPAIASVDRQVRKEFQKRVNDAYSDGGKSAAEKVISQVNADHAHEVTKRLAEKLGWTYKRTPYKPVKKNQ